MFEQPTYYPIVNWTPAKQESPIILNQSDSDCGTSKDNTLQPLVE
jgi:hypothetical protein